MPSNVPSRQCAAVTISSSLFFAAVPSITVAVQLRLRTPSTRKVSLPTVGISRVAVAVDAPACMLDDEDASGARAFAAVIRLASGTHCVAAGGRAAGEPL